MLRELYRDAGIDRRKVNYVTARVMNRAAAEEKRRREASQLQERYQFALKFGLHVIFIDEVKF